MPPRSRSCPICNCVDETLLRTGAQQCFIDAVPKAAAVSRRAGRGLTLGGGPVRLGRGDGARPESRHQPLTVPGFW
jgi:hypothetical protein